MNALRGTLDRLVADAVLTPAQAAAVLAGVDQPSGGRRISPAAEVVGYLGGVLATVAAGAVASRFWWGLGDGTQFAFFCVVAAALWGAGRLIATVEDPAAGRLMGTLWLLATCATAAAAWVLGDGLLGWSADAAALLVGGIATAQALALWRLRQGALQQVALFGGVATTIVATGALTTDPPEELYGLTVWTLGVVWALLAWAGAMRPGSTGTAIGAVTAVVGAEMLTFAAQTPGLLLSLATVGALFAAAAATRSAVFVGVASVTLAIVLPQALSVWFPDSVGAPAAVFIAGSILLGGALMTIRAARSTSSEPAVSAERR